MNAPRQKCEFFPDSLTLTACSGMDRLKDIEQRLLVDMTSGELRLSIATMRVSGKKVSHAIPYCPACGTRILPEGKPESTQ
jgi:hypothetical protein